MFGKGRKPKFNIEDYLFSCGYTYGDDVIETNELFFIKPSHFIRIKYGDVANGVQKGMFRIEYDSGVPVVSLNFIPKNEAITCYIIEAAKNAHT